MTEIASLQKQAFLQLKPHCVAVSQIALAAQVNSASALQLANALEVLYTKVREIPDPDDVISSGLGDYIFFPLSYVFRQHKTLPDRVVELALNILHILVTTCWRISISRDLARQLLILVTFIVGGSPGAVVSSTPQRMASEETKIAGCKCLLGLFHALATSESACSILTEERHILQTGHMIATLLETAVGCTESAELGPVCIDALDVLYRNCLQDADVIASFLPGTVSQLCKILSPATRGRVSYKLLIRTIELLGGITLDVLRDTVGFDLPTDATQNPGNEEELKVHRTQSWFNATATQVKLAWEGIIIRNRSHSKVEVRRALARVCCDLLSYCRKALEVSGGIRLIVEAIVIFSGDDDPVLAESTENSLRELSSRLPVIGETLKQIIHGWITSMPRVMQSNDEAQKVKLVNRISAGFSMMSALGLQSPLLLEMIAQNIFNSLQATNSFAGKESVEVQPQIGDLNHALTFTRTSTDELLSKPNYPDLVMGHRSQMGTAKSLKRLVQMIGNSAPATTLELAQVYIREASDGSPISLWLALHLIRAISTSTSNNNQFLNFEHESSEPFLDELIEELLPISLALLTTGITVSQHTEGNTSDGVLSSCFALESIAAVASIKGAEFRHELVDVLYPINHLLGSPSPTVQQHAIITLNSVASSCLYPSPKDLILDNVDYLVNAVALRLNTYDISPQAPVVLQMMVRLTGKRLVPFLDDLVESIFGVLANYHGYDSLSTGLFKVLKEIVDVSTEGSNLAIAETNRIQKRKVTRLTEEGLLKRLQRNERRMKKARTTEAQIQEEEILGTDFPREPWGKTNEDKIFDAEAFPNGKINDEGVVNACATSDPAEPKAAAPTKTYKLIQSITRLSQHYLTHPSPYLRLQLLQLVSKSSTYLAGNEDEFLPLVNDIWPVLFNRLFDEETPVVIAAADSIGNLATSCGEFLTSRIQDGWNEHTGILSGCRGIKKLMLDAKATLNRQHRGSAGRGIYSPKSQIWNSLLRMLALVLSHCELSEEIAQDVREIVGDVLEGNKELREALEEDNADAVWLEIESRRTRHSAWDTGAKPAVEGFIFKDIIF